MRVALFPTCLVDAIAPEVGVSTVRILRRLGHEVLVAERATCCGQPAWNSGHAEAAAEVARTTLDALHEADADAVIVPAGSCATMMRVFWRELFELERDPAAGERVRQLADRTYELAEFLDRWGPPETTRPDPTESVYHRSCHMLRELGITDAPERLVEATGARRAQQEGSERCCGFGGLFSIKLPEVSTAMADDVLDAMVATGASRVVGCDASCLMQLDGRAQRRALGLEFRHLATVIDDASAPQEED